MIQMSIFTFFKVYLSFFDDLFFTLHSSLFTLHSSLIYPFITARGASLATFLAMPAP
jgi:hypothetical protein